MENIITKYASSKEFLRLSPRDAELIEFRFGFSGNEKHTVKETAKRFSISPSRVGQIIAKVEYKIQNIPISNPI